MSERSTAALVGCIRAAVAGVGHCSRTDAELLADFVASGDAAAYEAIVRRHGPLVLSACRQVLRNECDADDAFQATFLVLHRRAKSIRNGRGLGGWLFRVARRAALELKRAAERRDRCEAKVRRVEPAEGPDLSWREACAILHEELDRLPDSYRLPLILCYLEGKSRDEAARELGWSLNVVRGRLERGRVRLRGRIEKRGLALSAGLLAALAPSARAVPARLTQNLIESLAKPAATVAAVARAISPGIAWKAAGVLALAAGVLAVIVAATARNPVAAGQPAPDAPPAAVKKDPSGPLQPGEPIAVKGRVLGPDGKPVAGVKLHVIDRDRDAPAPQSAPGADGSFSFTIPAQPNFRYRYLLATSPKYGCDWIQLPSFRPDGEFTLRLPEDVPITGRILDLEGKPVAGANVRLEAIDTARSDNLDEFLKFYRSRADHESSLRLLDKRLLEGDPLAALFQATSDADGRFSLRGIGKDRVPGFIVRSKAHAQDSIRVVTRPDFRDKIDGAKQRFHVVGPEVAIALSPAKVVTGTVRDAVTKKPLAGIRVAVQFMAEATFLRNWHSIDTKTDADGRYTLHGMAKTKSNVVLFDAEPDRGYLHHYAAVDDSTDFAPVTLDVDLQRGVVIEGRLTDKDTGKPVRAHVWYRPLQTNEFDVKTAGYEWLPYGAWADDDTTRTDADGRYKLTALPGPGLLHIQMHGLNPTIYPPTRLDPKDEDRGVYGKVFPQSNFVVFKTGGRGGGYGPESLNGYRVLEPKPNEKSITVDVALWAGHTRRVQVLDAGGKPLAGAEAAGLDPISGFEPAPAETTVYALDPERPRLVMFRHSAKKLFALLTLKGTEPEPIELRLEPTATVTGRFVDATGKPLAGPYSIKPSYQDHPIGTLLNTEFLLAPPRSPVVTDADGRFRLEGLPGGIEMHLMAQGRDKNDYWYTKETFKLKAGEVKDLGDWKRE